MNESIENLKLIEAQLSNLDKFLENTPGREAMAIRAMILSIHAAVNGGGLDILSAYVHEAAMINNKMHHEKLAKNN